MFDRMLESVPRRSRHVLCISWDGAVVKVCQVQFYKDWLFVHFPYHPASNGILARGEFGRGVATKQFDLREIGWATSHKVKYSHPINGRAHFSQDRRIFNRVFNPAMPLDTGSGHIFTLTVAGLAHFAPVMPGTPSQNIDVYTFSQAQPPPYLYLIGIWQQLDSVQAAAQLCNPLLVNNQTSQSPSFAIGIAPPDTSPLASHILLVQTVIRPLQGYDEVAGSFELIFIGGFQQGVADADPQSLIMLRYPASDTANMPSIDYS